MGTFYLVPSALSFVFLWPHTHTHLLLSKFQFQFHYKLYIIHEIRLIFSLWTSFISELDAEGDEAQVDDAELQDAGDEVADEDIGQEAEDAVADDVVADDVVADGNEEEAVVEDVEGTVEDVEETAVPADNDDDVQVVATKKVSRWENIWKEKCEVQPNGNQSWERCQVARFSSETGKIQVGPL